LRAILYWRRVEADLLPRAQALVAWMMAAGGIAVTNEGSDESESISGLATPDANERAERDREEVLSRLQEWLEGPMSVLGFVWLALILKDLVSGLSPFLQRVTDLIWVLFSVDFLVRFLVAPRKIPFLKKNVLTLFSLALPALRFFRFFRFIRLLRVGHAARGVRMVRLMGSLNRGMRALNGSMRRRGAGYAAASTLVVTLAGAAGMLAFEGGAVEQGGFEDYGTALWWTAMLMTTMGSESWPRTPEGRLLCLFLALYAFAVFGYVTAALASFFVGRDAESGDGEVAGEASLESLRSEVASMSRELAGLRRAIETRDKGGPL